MSTVLASRPNSKSPISTLEQKSNARAAKTERDRLIELMKSMYQAEHQVEFLHLQAEADTLLQELRTRTSQQQIADRS
ncbi:MAG: hypothetical protein F6J93_24830 [Oscillatoria sp. SIO1A7]|nr:hypothetical protein [Oscillatoria sp. SIO1A7]